MSCGEFPYATVASLNWKVTKYLKRLLSLHVPEERIMRHQYTSMLNITITSTQVNKLNLPQGYKTGQTTVCLFPYWNHFPLFTVLLLDIGAMAQLRTAGKPESLDLA